MSRFDDLIPSRPSAGGFFADLIPNRSGSQDFTPDDVPEEEATPSSRLMRQAQRFTSSEPPVGGGETAQEPERTPEPAPARSEPVSETDTTDDARAARGFGRSNYQSGLVDAPSIPGADTMGTGVERTARGREDAAEEPAADEGSIGTLGRIGRSFEQGEAQAITAGKEGSRRLSAAMEEGPLGRAFYKLRQAVGIETDTPEARAEAIRNEPRGQIEREAEARLEELQEEGFRITGLGDIDGIASAGRFVAENTAMALPYMVAGLAAGPTQPQVMMPLLSGEVFQELDEKLPDMPEREKANIAAGAGAAMWALETAGLGVVVGKMLPSDFAKRALRGELADTLMERGLKRSAARLIEAGVVEGSTEALQEGVVIGATSSAGGEYTREEVTERLVEAFAGGAGAGVGLRAGVEVASGGGRNDDDGQEFLTPEDRNSPIPDDILGRGKKRLAEIAAKSSRPTPPQGGVAPLDEGGANVRTPRTDAGQQPSPLDQLSPDRPQQPVPGEAPRGLGRDPRAAPESTPSEVAQRPEAAEAPESASGTPEPAQRASEAAPIPPDRIAPDTDVDMVVGDGEPTTGRIVRTTQDGPVLRDESGDEYVVPQEDIDDGEILIYERGQAPRPDQPSPQPQPSETPAPRTPETGPYEERPDAAGPAAPRITTQAQQESNDQARQEPVPQAEGPQTGETPQGVAAPDARETATPARRVRPQRSAPRKRPLTDELKSAGVTVDPDGPAGRELRQAGITAQNTPGLFRRGGRTDLDNIVAGENPYLSETLQRDDTGNYYDRNSVIDGLVSEFNGRPVQDATETELDLSVQQREREKRRLKEGGDIEPVETVDQVDRAPFTIPDPNTDISTPQERTESVRSAVRDVEREVRTILTDAERRAVYDRLDREGGDVEDIIMDEQVRSYRNEAGTVEVQREGEGLPDRASRGAGRPQDQRQGEAQGAARSENDQRDGRAPERASREGQQRDVAPGNTREGWVIREKNTGEVVMETRDRAKVDALNTERYEAVPVRQHLADLNRDTPAARAAGQTPASSAERASGSEPEGPGFESSAGDQSPTERTEAGQSEADWWTRTSRENDGAEARNILERAGVAFSNIGRPWKDIRPGDQEKILAARQGQPATERTEAGEQSVIPGAEQDATRSERARESDQRREMEARQRQSRMGTTEPQDDPGGLFDTQGDMLDQAAAQDTARDTPQPARRERIEDMGEKIGGARKDTSTPTGSRGGKPKTDNETPAWRKRYQVNEIAADAFDKSRVGKFTITDTRSKTGRIPGVPRGKLDFDTREQAEAALPMIAVARNHRVVSEGGGTFRIVRDVSDRKRPMIRGGFESREAAQKYMAENAEEIIETKTRIDDNIHPALEQALREGEARRDNGRDVNGQDFMDIFGFRGVEFGEWNNTAERQHILNQSFDAFLDLAEITGIPPKAVSLNGELAVAFGARGHGLQGARAHYERNYGVINLTKIKGAGALAHEWMHALDHYFARQDGKAASEKVLNERGDKVFDASENAARDYVSHGFKYKSEARKEVIDAIKAVMDTIYKRRQAFKEDVSTREKIENRAGERLDKTLKGFRDNLAREQSYGRKKAPATKQQLLKVDQQIKRIKKGDLGEMREAPSKAMFKPSFYDPVLKLAEIYKEVRGRQAYGRQQNRNIGIAHDIQNAVESKIQADKFLADAKEQRTKEKTVRTEFASEAWRMDQGAKKDYWSTNHEMLARAFESYVYDRLRDIEARNDFLAYEKRNDLPEYLLFQVKPYPEGAEREEINAALRNLFDTIETEETPEGTVRMYQRQISPFYSPLLRSIEGAKQKQAQAKDWKAILAKMPGVKQAEIEWLGVNEWLDAQDGQVRREDIAEFVRESQIEVVEDRLAGDEEVNSDTITYTVDIGDPIEPDWDAEAEIYEEEAREEVEDGPDFAQRVQARAEQIAQERFDPTEYQAHLVTYSTDTYAEDAWGVFNAEDGTINLTDAPDGWDAAPTNMTQSQAAEWAQEQAEGRRERETQSDDPLVSGPARFPEYSEPGGENYREVLLRVPDLHRTGKNKPRRTPEQESALAELDRQEQEILNRTGTLDQSALATISMRRNDIFRASDMPKRAFVQSAHFEQENIVVHARIKDRTGPNGEKVLFVEEIQSDLASVWRENQEAPEVTERRQELRDRRTELVGMNDAAKTDMAKLITEAGTEASALDVSNVVARAQVSLRNGYDPTLEMREEQAAIYETAMEADQLLFEEIIDRDKRIGEIKNEELRLGTEKRIPEGTPDTPFQQEHTYNLMVKRLLRMAAEEGYDRLSWTPGYMQAERWNSAAQNVVEGIEWRRIPSGVKGGTLTMAQGGEIVFGVSETTGKITESSNNELVGKDLSALVGPKLAKQIINEESGSVSGQKITFPDSGYAIAYDQQTRKSVDKLAKGTGAKVRVDKSLPDMAPSRDEIGRLAQEMPPQVILDWLIENGKVEGNLQESVDRKVAEGRSEDASRALLGMLSLGDFRRLASGVEAAKPVWSIDITDGLRAKALEPMAILRRDSVIDEQKVQTLLPDLKKRLDKLLIRNVDLRFDPTMTEQGAVVIDPNNDISILIGAALNDVATLNHEAVHVLRARGLFKDREWNALREAAEVDWMKRYDIATRYRDLDREGQIEEAIAEAFADWTGGNLKVADAPKGALARIKRFFKALIEALRGQGITTPSDIFTAIDRGDVGGRDTARQLGLKGEAPPKIGKASIRSGVEKTILTRADIFNRREQRQPKKRDDASFSNETIAEIARLNRETGQPLTPEQMNLPPAFEAPKRGGIDWFQELMQDKFIMFRTAERVIEDTTGQKLPEAMSFSSRETVFRGRTANRLEKVMRDEVRPITDAMSKEGVSLEDVGLYLIARHAPERNALIAKRNPERFGRGGGSGMTDEAAAQVMQNLREAGKLKGSEKVAKMVDTMLSRDLQNRRLAGLISDEQLKSWKSMYQHYTPLRGFAEREDEGQVGGTGAGFNIRGKEVVPATGRSSLSDNPLVQAIAMRQQGVVRAEKNRVGKALLKLTQKYPNPDLWEMIGKLPTREVLNRDTGMVQKMTDFQALNADELLGVKINGDTRYVRINDPLMAKAAKNLDDSLGDGLLAKTVNTISRATRAWSRLQTGANPDFVFPNGMSDFLEGIWTSYNVPDAKKMVRSYARYYPVALYQGAKGEWQDSALGRRASGATKKAIERLTNNEMSDEQLKKFDRYRQEWEASGGRINFMAFRDLDEITRDINKEIRRADQRFWQMKPWEAVENMAAVIEKVNQPVESAGRLAMYVAAREQGLSKERAAALSLDSSGNYYRRGRATRGLASFYAFFNPAVQGMEKFLRFSKRPKNWAILGGVATTGYSLALFNMLAWGDDDDPEETPLYLKIPEWERSRSLIIPYGTKEVEIAMEDGRRKTVTRLEYFSFRVPHNLRPLLMLGDQMAALTHAAKHQKSPTKHTTPGGAAQEVSRTILMNNNPFGSENMLTAISPTVTDPFADILQNRTWSGGIVHPKEYPWTQGIPKSQQFFERSTSDAAVATSQTLNRLSGGSALEPGAIDIYPDDIEHLFNYMTGGLGRFVERSGEAALNTVQGVETKTYRKPIVRSFSGATTRFAESERYYELRQEAQDNRNRIRQAKKMLEQDPGNTEAREDLTRLMREMNVTFNGDNFSWTNSTAKIFDKTDEKLKALRDQVFAVQNDERLSRPERIERQDGLQLQIEILQREARQRYVELLTEIGQRGQFE